MANVLAGIQVQLRANVTPFASDMDKAAAKARSASREMRQSITESAEKSRGGLAMLGDSIGVRLPRELRRFVSKMPAVSQAMNAAFDAVIVLALINVVVELGKKVYEVVEAFNKSRESAEAASAAFEKVDHAILGQNESLTATNDELDAAIAKLKGKPENGLALAIDDALKVAKQLNDSLSDSAAKIEANFKKNELGTWSLPRLATGARETPTDWMEPITTRVTSALAIITANDDRATEAIKDKYVALPQTKGNQANENAELLSQKNRVAGLRHNILNAAIEELQAGVKSRIADAAEYNSHLHNPNGADRKSTDVLEQQYAYLKAQYEHLDTGNTTAKEIVPKTYQKDVLTREAEAKKAAAEATKAQGEIAKNTKKQIDELNAALTTLAETSRVFDTNSQRQRFAGAKLSPDDQKMMSVVSKSTLDYVRAIGEGANITDKNSDALKEQNIRLQLANGAITQQEAAASLAALHTSQYNATMADLDAQLQIIASMTLPAMEKKAAEQNIRNAKNVATGQYTLQHGADVAGINDAATTASKGMNDFFREFQRDAQDSARTVHDALTQMMDGINSELTKAIMGDKTSFASVFKSVGATMINASLKKAESGVLNALHLGKKDGSSAGNALYVQVVNGSSMGLGGLFGGLTSGDGSDSGDSGGGKGFLGKIGGFFASIFGGHHANGGDIDPYKVSVVGENGPELLTGVRGHITPNHKIAGMLSSNKGTNVYNIDATGTNPAEVDMRVRQGMTQAHNQAVATTMQAEHEKNRRRPQSFR